MKIKQLKSIHNWVRSSETSEIVFVNALILPLYLLFYNTAINQINEEWKNWVILFALVLYIVGLIWMKSSQSKEEKNLKDLLVIKNYMIDKEYRFISFERIEKEIDKRLNEERIKELLFIFPNEFRFAKLKDNKKGIKILDINIEE